MQHDVTIELPIHDNNEPEIRTKMKAFATRKRLETIVMEVSEETFPDVKGWNITIKWNDIDLTSRSLNQLNSQIPVVITIYSISEAEKNDIINHSSFLEDLKSRINEDQRLRERWPGFKVANINEPKSRATKGTLGFICFVISMILLIKLDSQEF